MKKYKFIILFIIIFLIIGLFFSTKYLSQLNKTKITISTIPTDAKIYINGKLTNNKIIYSKNGEILITVSKDNYYEYRKIYNVNNENINISLKLIKKPEKTINELVYSSEYDNLIKRMPIIKKLPFNTFLVKISYTNDSTLNTLTLNINAHEGSRDLALDIIRDWGYDPSEYNIKFINYENPFKL